MRDWGATIGAFGLLLLASVITLCALLVAAGSVFLLITEGTLGYILFGLVALGFACIGGSLSKWCFDAMVDA